MKPLKAGLRGGRTQTSRAIALDFAPKSACRAPSGAGAPPADGNCSNCSNAVGALAVLARQERVEQAGALQTAPLRCPRSGGGLQARPSRSPRALLAAGRKRAGEGAAGGGEGGPGCRTKKMRVDWRGRGLAGLYKCPRALESLWPPRTFCNPGSPQTATVQPPGARRRAALAPCSRPALELLASPLQTALPPLPRRWHGCGNGGGQGLAAWAAPHHQSAPRRPRGACGSTTSSNGTHAHAPSVPCSAHAPAAQPPCLPSHGAPMQASLSVGSSARARGTLPAASMAHAVHPRAPRAQNQYSQRHRSINKHTTTGLHGRRMHKLAHSTSPTCAPSPRPSAPCTGPPPAPPGGTAWVAGVACGWLPTSSRRPTPSPADTAWSQRAASCVRRGATQAPTQPAAATGSSRRGAHRGRGGAPRATHPATRRLCPQTRAVLGGQEGARAVGPCGSDYALLKRTCRRIQTPSCNPSISIWAL